MRNDWHGLIKILEIEHVRDGKVIWEQKNLYNVLHTLAEQFFLGILFSNVAKPTTYYFGLDARTAITADDTMESVTDEPTVNGYLRQQASSSGAFNVQLVTVGDTSVYRAIGPIITFQASGGSWGPVNTLFMTDKSDYTGTLLSSVPLSQALTLNTGDSINMRMSLSLRDAPLS
jgi:hypothetical protein